MSDYVPMTRDGYNRIKAEVERLENDEMPRISEKIAEARAEGLMFRRRRQAVREASAQR